MCSVCTRMPPCAHIRFIHGQGKGNIMANYGNSRERIKFDFGLNLGFMVFTFYLSDLLIGVGFVTGVTFTTHLWIVDFIDFWPVGENQPLSLGCYFWERGIFSNSICFLNFAKPLYQNVRIDHRITFIFVVKNENHGKLQVVSWFLGFSLIFDFSVYFNYWSRITFWGWGTTSRFLRCSKEQVPVGGGGPLPGP